MGDVSKFDKEKLKDMALTGASPQELLDALDIANGMVLSAALLDLLRNEERIDQEGEKGIVKHYTMNPIREDPLKGIDSRPPDLGRLLKAGTSRGAPFSNQQGPARG